MVRFAACRIVLLLIPCFLLLALAGAASADYVWNTICCSSYGSNYGAQLRFGYKATTGTSQQSWPTPTLAYGGRLTYAGSLDAGLVKTALYKTLYQNPDPSKYVLQAWVGPDWDIADLGNTFDVRIWGSTTTNTPSAGWRLYKLYDPISDSWGRTELTAEPIPNTAAGASMDAPWFSTSLPIYKTADPMQYRGGYILELSIPEPGCMAAVLTGLAALGAAHRRRK